MLVILLSVFIILVIPFSSFMIARTVYRALTAKKNNWAMLISSVTFLLCFLAISAATLAIVLYNVEFSR